MNSSTETKEVLKALHEAIADLPNPQNDAVNPHFKSKYVKLDAAMSWVKPRLAAAGIRVSQPAITRDGWVGCLTRFTHGASGQWVDEGEFLVPFKGDDPQKAMSALTYARRGALFAALGVAGTDDDDDGNFASATPKPAAQPKGPTIAQMATSDSLHDDMERAADAQDTKAVMDLWAGACEAREQRKITEPQFHKIMEL